VLETSRCLYQIASPTDRHQETTIYSSFKEVKWGCHSTSHMDDDTTACLDIYSLVACVDLSKSHWCGSDIFFFRIHSCHTLAGHTHIPVVCNLIIDLRILLVSIDSDTGAHRIGYRIVSCIALLACAQYLISIICIRCSITICLVAFQVQTHPRAGSQNFRIPLT
jgi:hypothetical protein